MDEPKVALFPLFETFNSSNVIGCIAKIKEPPFIKQIGWNALTDKYWGSIITKRGTSIPIDQPTVMSLVKKYNLKALMNETYDDLRD